MEFSDEQYVRIYTGISDSGRIHGFFGRVLLEQLIKSADRAGVVELSESLVESLPVAVAAAVGCPDVAFVAEHLPKLLADPSPSVVFREPRYLVIPRYIEAQTCPASRRHSYVLSRDRTRAYERAQEIGLFDESGNLRSA